MVYIIVRKDVDMKKIFKFCKNILMISVLLVTTFFMFHECRQLFKEEKNENVFKVGMECSYAPFNWIQPTSKNDAVKISDGWYACGYDVYMAREIAKKMGKKLKVVKVDWDGLLPALTSGKIDAIIAGMSATSERKQAIDFTDNYYTSNIVIVTKKNGKYSDASKLEDFSEAKITGQLSTIHYDLIDQIPKVKKETALEDFSSMVSALNAGKIDGYVSEKPSAMAVVSTNPNLKYIEFENDKGFKFSQEEIAISIGVKKGSSLKDEINEALSTISEETRNKIMDKAVKNQLAINN